MIYLKKTFKLLMLLIALCSFIGLLVACSEHTADLKKPSENNGSENVEDSHIVEEQPVTKEIDFKVDDIWMRPTEAGGDAEVYMSMNNQSNEQVDLHDAMISGVSYQVTFYEGSDHYVGGYIEVPAGETVHLAPGDLHLVFEDIDQNMDIGDTFNISLHLTPYGDINFQGVVEDR